MNKRPGGALHKASDTASKSQIFPLMSKGRELTQKAHLAPALATLAFVVGMFATLGKEEFDLVIAGFLAFAGYYLIYRLCGKTKPWWLLAGVALVTAILMVTPLINIFILIFREILPGEIPKGEDKTFPITFLRMFFGAGLMEELFKALPVLGLAWLGGRLAKPWRERIGVLEPLDGILIGAASGAGFTLLETLGQYVPGVIHQAAAQYGEGVGQWVGLQLLIPRLIGSLFGHMAYSGYFGYFIGLSVLRPANSWIILGIGYLTAAATHAFWNSAETLGTLALLVAGGIAYALLTAAILKARQISPSRQQNFASQVIGMTNPPAGFSLWIGRREIVLHPGSTIPQSGLPGLSGNSPHGIIAVVDHSPRDPTILGLKNLSQNPWRVTLAEGGSKPVLPGQSIRLAIDITIDFGGVMGYIR